MKIGLAYDLKEEVLSGQGQRSEAAPDDALEEYDSPETIEGLIYAIQGLGHSVVKLGGGRSFLENVLQEKVDFVFNISEGLGNYRSREAQIPSVLEMLDIPYSGSDPQCLAICLDKALTKRLVSISGISTPRWVTVNSSSDLDSIDWDDFPFPAFVKPVFEGSSKGVKFKSRVEDKDELRKVVTAVLAVYQQTVMIEQFIPGEEITVGVIGNSPPGLVGIMRVVPRNKTPDFIYSIEIKRDWENQVDYECPPNLPFSVQDLLARHSLKAFDILGCRDFGRVDFRVSSDGTPYFLEVNPLAGLNPRSSDLPIMARKMGWDYKTLVASILEAATKRYAACAPK